MFGNCLKSWKPITIFENDFKKKMIFVFVQGFVQVHQYTETI
jgi:hypothetical protein